jgi:hypothetical protein
MHTVILLGAVLMFPVVCLVLLLLLDRLESGLEDAVMKAARRTDPAPVTAMPVRVQQTTAVSVPGPAAEPAPLSAAS